MKRPIWLAGLLLVVAATPAAARRPRKAKPKGTEWLDHKKDLWYCLHVPQPYDPNTRYPLLVVTAYRDDRAQENFKYWRDEAKLDQIVLATLNFPRGFKGDREKALLEMIKEIAKTRENIALRRLVLLGAGTGADQALKFIASYPRVFAVAIILNPERFPDLAKLKPGGPRLAGGTPRVYFTYNPDNEDNRSKLADTVRQLRRRHLRVRAEAATPEGAGQASPKEHAFALKALRSVYSPERRKRLAEAWRAEADKERKEKEEQARKLAQAQAELEGEPGPGTQSRPTEPAEEPRDPDSLWLKANELQNQEKDYAAAIEVYQKLLKAAPDSAYAAEARKRITALKNDPQIQRAIADQSAGAECKKWLSLAANYQRAGLSEKAVLYYKKIIDEHPDSSFAVTARKALSKIQGDQ